ncbi:M14 family zinc carboxypeptidase [Amphritea sp.]|uniref:M14 family zinc carboxypeptidase n=1 Tax=Amphritea sp. TaxID=1872502 RepID=UPI003D0C998D
MGAPGFAEPADPLSLYTTETPPQAESALTSAPTSVADEKPETGNPDVNPAPPPSLQTLDKVSDTPATTAARTDVPDSTAPQEDSQAAVKTPPATAQTETSEAAPPAEKSLVTQAETGPDKEVIEICNRIGEKLSSVSAEECLNAAFAPPRFYSNHHLPLLEKHFPASPKREDAPRILFLGGIHGDEYSSVSISFKWLKILQESHSGVYDWHFMPLTNPDGLLQKKSTRVNANHVDLNRNFIPAETAIDPIEHWQTYAKKRARYYPGAKPLSEPETQAIHLLIDELQPDIIVSVHAPHGILDYDGTITPPRNLGPLQLKQLGTYPGSLGNYGWFVKQIPVMTIELKHAGIMPKQHDIDRMWADLIQWIKQRTEGDGTLLARKESMREKKPTL